ncbi:hypothetical protein [Devosia beringensis]|uniref:hypothetical protein n=1 Tax=Devosia beringensis TaxID=2657486 RepID=UPI00186B8000|nr:hypothetical protein [Devosia beringensis]
MAQSTPTFLEEFFAAAQGAVALLTGDRKAPTYFDFSQRGLVGSFIAFLLAGAISAFGPRLLGLSMESGAASTGLLMSALLYALQTGAGWLVLRQFARLDGFVPYLVAFNWINLFASLILMGLLLVGAGQLSTLVVGVAALVIEINIARLIVTLAPLQIVVFIIAKLVVQAIVMGLIIAIVAPGMFMPPVA